MNTGTPLVSINCTVYNHAKYLRQCLDGFVCQKTNFKYVAIVHDDASTDNSAEIIREYAKMYPDIIQPILQTENQYSKNGGLVRRIMRKACQGKYIAYCEGDDYWIDPYKLQKQVDFMESHPDYGLIHTDYDLVSGRRNHNDHNTKEDGICFPSILTEGLVIGTCTAMARRSVVENCKYYWDRTSWPMGDYPLWIEIAQQSKIKYISDVTAHYRVLSNSASHSQSIEKLISFKNAGVEITQYYANIFGVKLEGDGFDKQYYESIVRLACRLDDKEKAIEYYKKAKTEGLVSYKCILFYVCSRIPWLKRIVNSYIKI